MTTEMNKLVIQLLEKLEAYFSNAICEDIDIEVNETTEKLIRRIYTETGMNRKEIQEITRKKVVTLQGSLLTEYVIEELKNG
jgi:hypothetical protein